jgi:hypothetical protein
MPTNLWDPLNQRRKSLDRNDSAGDLVTCRGKAAESTEVLSLVLSLGPFIFAFYLANYLTSFLFAP